MLLAHGLNTFRISPSLAILSLSIHFVTLSKTMAAILEEAVYVAMGQHSVHRIC